MPRYEYHCQESGRTVEVEHAMSERLSTWGELCRRAGVDPGDTPANAPVEKVISLPAIGGSQPHSGPGFCGPACGCHPHG